MTSNINSRTSDSINLSFQVLEMFRYVQDMLPSGTNDKKRDEYTHLCMVESESLCLV